VAAGEKRQVAERGLDADRLGAFERDEPGFGVALDTLQPQVVHSEEPALLTDESFSRLDRERVAGTPAIVLQGNPALEVVVHHPARGFSVDTTEVQALRQADEVAGEAVAADVARLPDPIRIELVSQGLVERAAVAGAA